MPWGVGGKRSKQTVQIHWEQKENNMKNIKCKNKSLVQFHWKQNVHRWTLDLNNDIVQLRGIQRKMENN